MLMPVSLIRKLPTPITNVVQGALAQSLELLGIPSVEENSRNEEFELMKDERDCFLENVNAYKM